MRQFKESVERYGLVAQALHWAGFALLCASFWVGLSMVDLPVSPQRIRDTALHKSIGVTIFLLTALRLLWRQLNPPPPLPASMPAWEKAAAGASHTLLYLLVLAVPASGWLMSSALGFPTRLFGLAQLPDLIERNRELGEFLKQVHFLLNKSLLALVALHVAAALKHHLVDRDGVLLRMLPGAGARKEAGPT